MSHDATVGAPHNASSAWANWLWLADPPSYGTALSLGSRSDVAQALSRTFTRVEQSPVEPGRLHDAWDPQTFDLIAWDGAGDPEPMLAPEGLWSACVRVLRPGGCLMLTIDNALWHRRLSAAAKAYAQVRDVRRHHRVMRDAGFRSIRGYYMTPSAGEPRSFIPMNREVVAGYEQVARKLSTHGALRSRLGRVGLHPVLYPATLYLASV